MGVEQANEVWRSLRRQEAALRAEGATLRDKVLHLEEVKLDYSRKFWKEGMIKISDRWEML